MHGCLGLLLLSGVVSAVGQAGAAGSALAGSRVAGVRARTAATEVVGGRVLSAKDGHPVPRASLTLSDTNTGRLLATVKSDAEGRFRFEPLAAGKYALRATATGYVGAAYQEHEGFSTALVLGKGFETGSLEMRLVPGAVIRGHVSDASGDPLQRAMLTLYQVRSEAAGPEEVAASEEATGPVRVFGGQGAAEDGSFAFEELPPGRYYLSANATPWYATHARPEPEGAVVAYRAAVDPTLDVAYPETFYPHARVAEEATPLKVAAGEQVKADLQMQAERAVTLTLRLPQGEPGQQARAFPMLMRSVFGVQEPLPVGAEGGPNGEVEIHGLVPGRYELQGRAGGGRFAQDGGAVDLTNGSVTMDAPAVLSAGGSATLRVKVSPASGGALPPQMRVVIRGASAGVPAGNRGPRGASLMLPEKDEVEVPDLPLGEYRIDLFAEGRSREIATMRVDGKPVPEKRLRVTSSGVVNVEVTVGGAAVSVEGFVAHEGKPVAGSMVVLVPAGTEFAAALFRRDQSDMDGSFLLRNVLPGNYILVAIEDGWAVPWNSAAGLAKYLAKGTPVVVPEGGGATLAVRESVVGQVR